MGGHGLKVRSSNCVLNPIMLLLFLQGSDPYIRAGDLLCKIELASQEDCLFDVPAVPAAVVADASGNLIAKVPHCQLGRGRRLLRVTFGDAHLRVSLDERGVVLKRTRFKVRELIHRTGDPLTLRSDFRQYFRRRSRSRDTHLHARHGVVLSRRLLSACSR